MAGKLPSVPFYVVYGEEDFLLDRVLDRCQGPNTISLDGDGLQDFEVVSELEQGYETSGRRIVTLDNATKVKGDKALNQYIADRSLDDASVTLVAVVRGEKLTKLWQAAGIKGKLEQFRKAKPWETELVRGRIAEEAKRLGLSLEDNVPDLFIGAIGDNLRKIVNELTKLSFVVQGKVTAKDAMGYIAADLPADPFDVAKVATNKESKKALRLVSTLFKTTGEGVALPITAGLLSHVERLLVVRQMLDRGTDLKVIAEAIGVPAFPVQKDIVPRARKYTSAELLTHMKTLCRLDAQVKGPARSKRTLVELAVLSIAA